MTQSQLPMRHFLLLCFCCLTALIGAQDSHDITVKIKGYDQPFLSIANNVMDKQYVVDTAWLNKAGEYVFASDTSALPKGIYLVVLAPKNDYFQMVIGDDPDQKFRLETTTAKLNAVKTKSSLENELFYDYLAFLDAQGQKAGPDRDLLQDSTLADADRDVILDRLDALNSEVDAHQADILKEHPKSFVAAVIRVNQPNSPPAFDALPEAERMPAQLDWLRAHYFDPIDLSDDRLLRTPFLFSRINYYVDKLFIQHPDTLATAIDYVLGQMKPESDMFKYYVVHFTNQASSSKIIGMDALYVHMVDNYYNGGKAYWADQEQIDKMVSDANKSRPLLIGKQAPNMTMNRRDGTPVDLYEVDAKYTILYFWQFDCGSCKKSTPIMKEFYAKWKDKGVEIFSICTKQGEIDKCWDYIDETEIGDWLHATDRYMRFYKDYDIKSTPTIFVLDENKEIVSKRLAAEQLDELLTALEEQKQLETTEKSAGKR